MGSASSATTLPSAAAAKPPRSAISRFTAIAMSSSLQPMTQILWLSWPTDEAMAMERAGIHARLVEGSEDNFKITTPADLARFEFMVARR